MSDVIAFNDLHDEISGRIQNLASQVLRDQRYSAGKVAEWIDSINNSCVDNLKKLSPNFKYVVSSIVQQKVGAGLHYSAVSLWDAKHDGSVTVKFENETMTCIVVVFGLSI
mmetsp:Transcript_9031/g.13573  ORF Transcript_9031/g.13573 Transcript_9031/m.13573 type:complete len:111 (-) Transcript_9031:216-548(-)